MFGVVARFAVYFGGMVSAVMLANRFAKGTVDTVLVGTTIVAAKLIGLIGIAARRSGTEIYLHGRILSIDLACTAIFIIALYLALLLAYPASVQHRLLGVAVGVPIIVVFNFARIVAAAAVSETIPSAFSFFHDYLFQVGMVLVTVLAWAIWLSLARRDAR
jgi:exosortase/archaeosortase family protein